MSALLVFVVDGPPLPWQRARSEGRKRFTAAKQRGYQELVQWTALAALSPGRAAWPLGAIFAVELDVYCGDKRRRDLDNFAKQIGDAGNGLLWADDAQIVEWRLRKHVDTARPRLEVRVREIADPAIETDTIMHGEVAR